jgi:hypothetical protein
VIPEVPSVKLMSKIFHGIQGIIFEDMEIIDIVLSIKIITSSNYHGFKYDIDDFHTFKYDIRIHRIPRNALLMSLADILIWKISL